MNIAQFKSKPRILVAPLDWGLGHVTRCIPIIRALLTAGATVLLAGDGKIAHLLKTEFPELPLLPLPGYQITYGKTRIGTLAALLRQVPKLQRAIRLETAWLQRTVQDYQLDAVISDNRYGLHHPGIYTVFITHQLQIKTPLQATDRLLQRMAYQHINQFNACWVPDGEGADNLAGILAYPKRLPQVPVTYIGPLSRFQLLEPVLPHFILILLSGPEPQRTELEQLVLQQAQLFKTPIFMVRGLPGATGVPRVPHHITIVNHLPAGTLQKAVESAQFVVSRCGYSTVMDMMLLQKKCIFIPTPMQTEQEYLAKYLMKHNRALCLPQHKFNLPQAVALAEAFAYRFPALEKEGGLQEAVGSLFEAIRAKAL